MDAGNSALVVGYLFLVASAVWLVAGLAGAAWLWWVI